MYIVKFLAHRVVSGVSAADNRSTRMFSGEDCLHRQCWQRCLLCCLAMMSLITRLSVRLTYLWDCSHDVMTSRLRTWRRRRNHITGDWGCRFCLIC